MFFGSQDQIYNPNSDVSKLKNIHLKVILPKQRLGWSQ